MRVALGTCLAAVIALCGCSTTLTEQECQKFVEVAKDKGPEHVASITKTCDCCANAKIASDEHKTLLATAEEGNALVLASQLSMFCKEACVE